MDTTTINFYETNAAEISQRYEGAASPVERYFQNSFPTQLQNSRYWCWIRKRRRQTDCQRLRCLRHRPQRSTPTSQHCIAPRVAKSVCNCLPARNRQPIRWTIRWHPMQRRPYARTAPCAIRCCTEYSLTPKTSRPAASFSSSFAQ